MLIEAVRRVEAAAREMLAAVNGGTMSCAEAREVLAACKSAVAVMSAAQTTAARVVARVERHGDGGVQVLADAAGMSRRDAHRQVKTAKTIEAAPAVRDAVEEGRVSSANAKRLAEVIEKTSAEAVDSDGELLAKAESMRPEQFTREARRWATDRQGDGGEVDYRRLRAKRCLRIWDTDDGMVRLHGEFDPVTGRRIGNRLQAEARRLYDADKKQASSDSERRSFHQCMADALDALTANNITATSKPFADICVVAHVDDETGKLVAELAGGDRLPRAVLEELACNAKFTGVVYDREGKPIWRTHSVRTATEAQRQILIAQYGGCFHCGANPAMCQIHHIKPVSQGGSTRLDNMVPVCWDCHNKIHHHHWQIHTTDGVHTLHPPNHINDGPAHAPEDPILHLPGTASDPILHLPDTNPQDPILHLPDTNPQDPILHLPDTNPQDPILHLPDTNPQDPILHLPDTNPQDPILHLPDTNPQDPILHLPDTNPQDPILHLPSTNPAPDPVPPRSPASIAGAPERQTPHQPGIAQAPAQPHSTRSGPAAARAALREAVAIRNGTPTERAPCPLDAHAGPLW